MESGDGHHHQKFHHHHEGNHHEIFMVIDISENCPNEIPMRMNFSESGIGLEMMMKIWSPDGRRCRMVSVIFEKKVFLHHGESILLMVRYFFQMDSLVK